MNTPRAAEQAARPRPAASADPAPAGRDATLLGALIEGQAHGVAELARRGRLPAFFLSDFSAANAYLFRQTYRFRVADAPDRAVVGVRRSGEPFRLATPLVAYGAAGATDVASAPPDLPLYPLAVAPAAVPFAHAQVDRDQSDYIYTARHLAALDGDHFKRIRRGIAQLYRRHDFAVRPLGPEAVAFVDAWAAARGLGPDGADVAACRDAIAMTSAFALDALAYLVDGEIAGISITDHALPNTSIVLFCKVSRRFPYLTDAIFNHIARSLAPDRYVNLCQDLGIDGLRAKKLFLQPAVIAHKYMVPWTKSEI